MKKRIVVLLVLAAMIFVLFAGCGVKNSDSVMQDLTKFKVIEGRECLQYDPDTRVIYYLFSTCVSGGYHSYSYMAPYISENGRYCRYVNDEIVEIIPENIQN